MKESMLGLGKFLGLVLICLLVAVISVAGLKYRIQPEKLVEIYQIKVLGTEGQTVSDLYNQIRPEGPIKPYDLMCATRQLKGQGYSYHNVIFPAWFHAPGGYVSSDTECSIDGNYLRTKYPGYKEIGS